MGKLSTTGRVVVLGLGMAAVTAALWVAGVPQSSGPLAPGALETPWWALLGLFVAAEVAVFHLQYRREAKSVSASEIPLVIGLHLAGPLALVLARVLSGLLVFVVHRRQTPLKVGFNVSLLALDTTVALIVFDLVAGGGHPAQDARGWAASVIAAAVTTMLDAAMLARVIAWYDGDFRWRRALEDLWFSAWLAGLIATVGFVPVLALALGPSSVAPLLAAGAVLVVGFRAYAGLADRHTNLARLYHFSETVTAAPTSDSVLTSVLQESRELLRAEQVHLFRPASTGGGTEVWSMHVDQPRETVTRAHETRLDSAVAAVMSSGRPVTVGPGNGHHSFLRRYATREAVLVPLRVDGTVRAVLAVADRLGEVRGFENEDVRLLETIANHAAIAMQNGHLIARLRYEAMHDELTGLPNRAMFHELAEEAAASACQGGPGAAVMIMDLDGFKAVNDTLGHQIGDRMLVELARRLDLAAVDVVGADRVVVARLGGDEFALLALGVSSDGEALAVATQVLATLDRPITIDTERLPLAASLGVALGPRDGTSASSLLRCADIAMYAAKRATGGARVFTPDLTGSSELLPLVGDLRECLREGRVGIEVQPVVAVATGALHSVEALVRWEHPDLGMLAPESFLALAERSGLVGPLTRAVLGQSLLACRAWALAGLLVDVAVNVSPRALGDPDLPLMVRQLLTEHGVRPERLTLEITEDGVIADPARAAAVVEELRRLGVRVSMDDFGTGFSSLSHLSRLPVQQLKIDKSLVTRLGAGERDAAIVRSIVDLGHNLGLEVVAEGVEDRATFDALAALGCSFAQGYYLARPMPPDRLVAWVQDRAKVSYPRTPETPGALV